MYIYNWLIASVVCMIAALWTCNNYPFPWVVRMQEPPPINSDGSMAFNLQNVYTPFTEEQIVEHVKMAYTSGRKLRVLGSGHSWSGIAQTEDIMVSLMNYTGLVRLDREKMTVTVRGGTKLSELNVLLDKEGLAMIIMPTITDQSIAGAIATGTHGAGITTKNMASLVSKFKFVSGTGEVMAASEDDEDQSLFHALQVSIGMLGIITEVTLHVEKAYLLEESRTYYPLDYCLDHLHEIAYKPLSKTWLDFHNDFCVLFVTKRTSNPIGSDASYVRTELTSLIFRAATYISYFLPALTPHLMWLVNIGYSANMTRTDISYKVFVDNMALPIHSGSEVSVLVNDSTRFVRALRDLVREGGHMLNFYQEIRFVAGDEAWLSPQYNRSATCALSLNVLASRDREDAYYSAVHKLSQKFNARVHWGKYLYWGPENVRQAYTNYNRFSELRKKLDPKNIYMNKFLEKLFDFV